MSELERRRQMGPSWLSKVLTIATLLLAVQAHSGNSIVVQESVARYAGDDERGFCHRNMLLRFLNSRQPKWARPKTSPVDISRLVGTRTSDLETQANKRMEEDDLVEYWNVSLVSTLEARERALSLLMKHEDDVFEFAQKREVSPVLRQMTGRILRSLSVGPATKALQTSSTSLLAKLAVCAEESFVHIGSCKNGLNLLQDRLTPVLLPSIKNQITRVDLYLKVLLNPRLDEGLRLAALIVSQRLKRDDFKGTLFDDISAAFNRSGLMPSEAENSAWDVLGLLSTGGADMAQRFQELERLAAAEINDAGPGMSQNLAALSYLSIAPLTLDSRRSSAAGVLYSYPSLLETKCDNAKPYHFWLAAYDARELVLRDHLTPRAAVLASFASEKAYQAARLIIKRSSDPKIIFGSILSEPIFGPVAQIVRTDIAYAALGAKFGVNSAQRLKDRLKFKDVIVPLILSARPISSISVTDQTPIDRYNQYVRWKTLFAPDAALGAVP